MCRAVRRSVCVTWCAVRAEKLASCQMTSEAESKRTDESKVDDETTAASPPAQLARALSSTSMKQNSRDAHESIKADWDSPGLASGAGLGKSWMSKHFVAAYKASREASQMKMEGSDGAFGAPPHESVLPAAAEATAPLTGPAKEKTGPGDLTVRVRAREDDEHFGLTKLFEDGLQSVARGLPTEAATGGNPVSAAALAEHLMPGRAKIETGPGEARVEKSVAASGIRIGVLLWTDPTGARAAERVLVSKLYPNGLTLVDDGKRSIGQQYFDMLKKAGASPCFSVERLLLSADFKPLSIQADSGVYVDAIHLPRRCTIRGMPDISYPGRVAAYDC